MINSGLIAVFGMLALLLGAGTTFSQTAAQAQTPAQTQTSAQTPAQTQTPAAVPAATTAAPTPPTPPAAAAPVALDSSQVARGGSIVTNITATGRTVMSLCPAQQPADCQVPFVPTVSRNADYHVIATLDTNMPPGEYNLRILPPGADAKTPQDLTIVVSQPVTRGVGGVEAYSAGNILAVTPANVTSGFATAVDIVLPTGFILPAAGATTTCELTIVNPDQQQATVNFT